MELTQELIKQIYESGGVIEQFPDGLRIVYPVEVKEIKEQKE